MNKLLIKYTAELVQR